MAIVMPAPPAPPGAKSKPKKPPAKLGAKQHPRELPGWHPNKKTGTYVDSEGNVRWQANAAIVKGEQEQIQRPVNWRHRHNLILYMDIAGQRTIDIAAELNYTPGRVATVKNSPLYQQQKAKLLEQLKKTTIEDLVESIRRDAPQNFKAQVSLRDDFAEHGGDPKVRLAATAQIARELDRVWPKKLEKHEEREIRVTFDQRSIAIMAKALAEAEGKPTTDAEYYEVDERERPIINPKGPQEMIEELNARAASELLSESDG